MVQPQGHPVKSRSLIHSADDRAMGQAIHARQAATPDRHPCYHVGLQEMASLDGES